MDISKRLKKIASLADESVIADIGCDHALVCIEALNQHHVQKAYACDLHPGPLEQAKINIAAQGLSDRIFTRLESGIHNLPEDTRQILICGMGGRLIEQILTDDPISTNVQSMLLSPHKDAAHLRQFLIEQGWRIEKEWMVEDGHFYPILKVVRQTPEDSVIREELLKDQESLLLGFHPEADEDYFRYLDWQTELWTNIAAKIPDPANKQTLLDQIQLANHRKQVLQGK